MVNTNPKQPGAEPKKPENNPAAPPAPLSSPPPPSAPPGDDGKTAAAFLRRQLRDAVAAGALARARELFDHAFWNGITLRATWKELRIALANDDPQMAQLMVAHGALPSIRDMAALKKIYARDPDELQNKYRILQQAGINAVALMREATALENSIGEKDILRLSEIQKAAIRKRLSLAFREKSGGGALTPDPNTLVQSGKVSDLHLALGLLEQGIVLPRSFKVSLVAQEHDRALGAGAKTAALLEKLKFRLIELGADASRYGPNIDVAASRPASARAALESGQHSQRSFDLNLALNHWSRAAYLECVRGDKTAAEDYDLLLQALHKDGAGRRFAKMDPHAALSPYPAVYQAAMAERLMALGVFTAQQFRLAPFVKALTGIPPYTSAYDRLMRFVDALHQKGGETAGIDIAPCLQLRRDALLGWLLDKNLVKADAALADTLIQRWKKPERDIPRPEPERSIIQYLHLLASVYRQLPSGQKKIPPFDPVDLVRVDYWKALEDMLDLGLAGAKNVDVQQVAHRLYLSRHMGDGVAYQAGKPVLKKLLTAGADPAEIDTGAFLQAGAMGFLHEMVEQKILPPKSFRAEDFIARILQLEGQQSASFAAQHRAMFLLLVGEGLDTAGVSMKTLLAAREYRLLAALEEEGRISPDNLEAREIVVHLHLQQEKISGKDAEMLQGMAARLHKESDAGKAGLGIKNLRPTDYAREGNTGLSLFLLESGLAKARDFDGIELAHLASSAFSRKDTDRGHEILDLMRKLRAQGKDFSALDINDFVNASHASFARALLRQGFCDAARVDILQALDLLDTARRGHVLETAVTASLILKEAAAARTHRKIPPPDLPLAEFENHGHPDTLRDLRALGLAQAEQFNFPRIFARMEKERRNHDSRTADSFRNILIDLVADGLPAPDTLPTAAQRQALADIRSEAEKRKNARLAARQRAGKLPDSPPALQAEGAGAPILPPPASLKMPPAPQTPPPPKPPTP